jgi:NAD(P)-dependent dehydrogenase (short-subunit alcohol dehydrogenase family)
MTNVHRAVLITGASTGIGRACAVTLSQLGYSVFAGVRQQEDARQLRGMADEGNTAIYPARLDVTRAEDIEATLRTVKAWQRGEALSEADGFYSAQGDSADTDQSENSTNRELAALVNNAGISINGPIELLDDAAWHRQFEVNFFGQVNTTQAFIPMLRAAKGRVVLISSIAGFNSTPFIAPYCASKHALEAFGDALRMELHPDGVHVSIIQPGAINTPIWRKAVGAAILQSEKLPPEHAKRYGQRLKGVRAVALKARDKSVSVDKVTKKVVLALERKNPRARYLVGLDAYFTWLSQPVPTRIRDKIVAWVINRASRLDISKLRSN